MDQSSLATYAAAAVTGLFGLLAWNHKWMASKVDRSQELLAKAVDKLSDAVDHMREAEHEAERRHREIIERLGGRQSYSPDLSNIERPASR